MHLITDDFDADGMNSKYAWGSFTTGFFMHPEKAISMLQREGRIQIDPVEASNLRGDDSKFLLCNACDWKFSNFRSLKCHISVHDKDRKGEIEV